MEREDIRAELWPRQVTANSLFTASPRGNNPFRSPEVRLLSLLLNSKSGVWLSQRAPPPGLQARRLPDRTVRGIRSPREPPLVGLVMSDWRSYFCPKHMERHWPHIVPGNTRPRVGVTRGFSEVVPARKPAANRRGCFCSHTHATLAQTAYFPL